MVRGQSNHGIVPSACFFEPLKKPAHLVIDLFDQAHIGRDYALSHIIAAERLSDWRIHESFQNRVCRLTFRIRADDRQDMFGPKHRRIWLRDDIGPVGLDIAEMCAPRTFGLLYELHCTARQVGCFAVGLFDISGIGRVLQEPA